MRTGDIAQEIRSRGGIAHSTTLRDVGFGDRALRVAVASGTVERVGRSWLASPQCDLALRRAAEVGGRLTCVSAAERAGLWVPPAEQRELHLSVPSTWSRQRRDGVVLHWAEGPVPAGRRELVDPMLNTLAHAARCVPFVDALCVWESAIRKGQADAAELARVAWRSPVARRLAAVASQLSDSGLETRFVELMRSIGVAVRQQAWIDGHPVDGLIGDLLAIQIDGFAHHQAADRRRDLRADARLALRGYIVLRFDYYQILFCPDEVIATVRMALAQLMHVA
ncbi:DUF559 domain-containing protein [Microbacterium sp.]|uniref:DUF559 domain-containing protein n=1 Tax=Microbacterium sp. TaxID=51671 RepID=UPI0039E64023